MEGQSEELIKIKEMIRSFQPPDKDDIIFESLMSKLDKDRRELCLARDMVRQVLRELA